MLLCTFITQTLYTAVAQKQHLHSSISVHVTCCANIETPTVSTTGMSN